jgi:hypothetical protein
MSEQIEQEYVSRKAKMVAADYNYIKQVCKVDDDTAQLLIQRIHYPLSIGSKRERLLSRLPDDGDGEEEQTV